MTSTETGTSGGLPSAPEKQEGLPPKRGFFDILHGELSHELLTTATWLDSFFGDERAVIEQNRSYVRFRYDVFQEERASLLTRPTFDLRLVLPQLEHKTHLVISGEPTQSPSSTPAPLSTAGEPIATTEKQNLTTALHYFLRATPGETFLVKSGALISNDRPVLFATPHYRSLKPLGTWDFRFTQEATYQTANTTWQTDTLFDLERSLPHDLFFRSSIEGVWYNDIHGYFYYLTFSLREVFDPLNALDYEWVNSYQTDPNYELSEIAFRVRYRHSFWRNWLYFEVAPQVRFPRAGNFDFTPGILFRIEAYVGREGPF